MFHRRSSRLLYSILGLSVLSFIFTLTIDARNNQAPVAVNDSYNVHGSITVDMPGILGNDHDPDGDQIHVENAAGTGTSGSTPHGTVLLYSSGGFTYTPYQGFVGTDSFTYRACDTAQLCSNTATVTFTVTNQPPTTSSDSYTVHASIHRDAPGLLGNDSDPEGDTFTLENPGMSGGTPHGQIDTYADGSFTYTAQNYVGTDTFTYRACDALGACSGYTTVTMTLVNEPPTVSGESYSVYGPVLSVAEDKGLLANDSDPEGDNPIALQNPTGLGGAGTTHGIIHSYGNGSFSYYPNSGFSGTDTYPYTVCDTRNLCSNATAYFFVTGDGQNAGGASCNSRVGAPVNVTNGNMYLQQNDYKMPGVGRTLNITRTYNSIIQTSGLFGKGWTSGYDESIWAYDSNLLRLNLPDGRAVYFGRTGNSGPFTARTPGFYDQIAKNSNGSYTVTFKNGDVDQFNSSGKLLSLADRNNNQTALGYDTNGKLVSITDSFGRVLTITPDAFGRVQQVSDTMGVIATYVYNVDDLQSVTYADGSKFVFTYTTIGTQRLLTTVTDALGNIVESHSYDGQGRATTSERQGGVEHYTLDYINATQTNATDALGHVTRYFFDTTKGRNVVTRVEGLCSCGDAQTQAWTYDSQLNITSVTNALNQTLTYTYDTNGNRLTMTDMLGTTTYTYNNFGEVLTQTDVMGGVTTNTYNAQGNLLTSKDALNNTTTLTYDIRGQFLTLADARNKVTTFVYTGGNLTRVTDASNNQTQYVYDGRARVTSATDALNQTTGYGYDAAGRINHVTYPDSTLVTVGYDLAGRRTSFTDARNKTTTYGYDGAYRLTSETNALNQAITYAYNLTSRLTSRTDALSQTTNYEYDDFNRLKKTIYPAASVGAARLEERLEYDVLGSVKKHVDTAGRETLYDYDNANRVIHVTDPALQLTQVEYNARSEMTALTDAANQRYTFAYDAVGRMTQTTRGGLSMSYEYDAVGNRTKRTSYSGVISSYTYDNLNRPTLVTYRMDANDPGTNQAATGTSYTYDALSRLHTAVNETGTVTINYDNRNRVSSVTDVTGQTINYSYDAAGNRTGMNLGQTLSASYVYDAVNRPTQLTDNAGSVFGFNYDAMGKLTSRTMPNNITSNYEYDGMNRLTRLRHTGNTGNLDDSQYQYNTANDITQISEPSVTHGYAYDAVDRLTSATQTGQSGETYAYDAVGNRTSSHLSQTYTYQPFNKVIATAAATYAYDNNGNLVSKTDAAGRWSYAWDAENRLVRVVKPGTLPLPFRIITYKYDALGRRVNRQMKRGGTTSYTYDGQDVILDQKSDGSSVTYVNGPGIDNKLKQTSTTTGTHYYLQDHLGSTTALINSSGSVAAQMSYDGYGNSAGSTLTRYGYTGREFDSDTGLIYYRARWYDPQLGRFISEDPIGFDGGINPYTYVENDPLNTIDPLGQDGVGIDRVRSRRKRRARGGIRPPFPPIQTIIDPPPSPPQPPAIPTPTPTPSNPPTSTGSDCGCETAIPRLPDYYSLSGSIPIPAPFGDFIGLTGSFTIDRYWHGYLSFGPTAPGGEFSYSGTASWIFQKCRPKPQELEKFLTGPSGSIHGFIPAGTPLIGVGGGGTWSPGYGGGALNLGVGSPGAGGSFTEGWELW